MAKVDLPYLQIVEQKGRVYAYYRRAGSRHPLPSPIGSPSFMATYNRIHAGYEREAPPRAPLKGSLGDCVARYRKDAAYAGLSPAARSDYDRYLDLLEGGDKDRGLEALRDYDIATLDWPFIKRVRSLYAATPRKAEYIRSMLSILCEVAIEEGYRKDNPCNGRKRLKGGDGHRPWEESEVEAFRQRWPLDSRERVAFELALNSGQRRGDVIAMTRAHYRDGQISVTQEKTGNRVWMPASQALREALDPFLARHSQIVLLATGQDAGFTKSSFSKFIRAAMTEAGLPSDCTMHGLRYTAATRVYELMVAAGRADEEAWAFVGAITGHATAVMARKYSGKKRRATIAIERLNNAENAKV